MRPEGGRIVGRIYTDGSMLDGPELFLARCGWSFVAIDEQGKVTAIARGVPPQWIDDIHGAEVWAMVQAALVATPGQCTYHCDCQSVVTAIHEGMLQATSAKNRYARAYAILKSALEDTPASNTIWIPAHGKGSIKGDGSLVSGQDREANGLADTHAKEAVETHRVSPDIIERWKEVKSQTKSMAMWTARVAAEANNHGLAPFRDSTASKQKGEEVKRRRKIAKNLARLSATAKSKTSKPKVIEARPPQLGGHSLRETSTQGVRSGWRCTLCKASSAEWSNMAAGKCSGSMAARWAKANITRANRNEMVGPDHEMVLSGDVMWCLTCGCYADSKSKGLSFQCKGVPKRGGNYGGAWGQIRKLRAGVHPKTGKALDDPIGLDGRSISEVTKASGTYSNLPAYTKKSEDEV